MNPSKTTVPVVLRYLLLLLLCTAVFGFHAKSATIYVNHVYEGAGSSYNTSSNSVDNISLLVGTGFRVSSLNPNARFFTADASGNDIWGLLTYANTSGREVQISGIISRLKKNNSGAEGFYFVDPQSGKGYFLVMAGLESLFQAGDIARTSSEINLVSALNAALNQQQAEPRLNIAAASALENAEYMVFTVSTSQPATGTYTFTPSLVAGTATAGTDFTSSMQYSTGGGWQTLSGALSLSPAVTSFQVRVPITDEMVIEDNETFMLLSGPITGGDFINHYGTYGEASILDNDGNPASITQDDVTYVYGDPRFTLYPRSLNTTGDYSYSITGDGDVVAQLNGGFVILGVGTTQVTIHQAPGDGYGGSWKVFNLTVTPAALQVRANDATKTYDGLPFSGGNDVTYSGWAYGETTSMLSGTIGYGGTAQNAVDAGNYTIIPSGLSAANYTITYVSGSLSVTKAPLLIAATDEIRNYDGNSYNGGNGVTYTGLVANETTAVLQGALAYGGNAQGAANAGTYDIVPSGFTSDNYDITYTNGLLTIDAAPLTIAALAQSKVYNGQPYTGPFSVSYSGFVGSDNETNALSGNLLYSGDYQAAKDAGVYTITPSGLSATNYTITFVDGTLFINKAILTVTAANRTKTYDGLPYGAGGYNVSYQGFVPGENSSVLNGTVGYSGPAISATNVGSYTITASGLSSLNYSFRYVVGTLTITRAALQVVVNSLIKTYDALPFNGGNGVTYNGFANGETASVLGGSLSYGGNAQGALNVGSYNLTASGYSSGNYTISYTAGTLTVRQATLTATVNSRTKTYDGVAFQGGNGVSYSGFAGSETSAVLTGNLVYGSSAQGAKSVGSYVLSASGIGAVNYSITYVNGTLTITPALLTIRAAAQTKTYDGRIFNGTHTVDYNGLVAGETPAVLGGTLGYNGSWQTATDVGSYTIVPAGLTAANYQLSYIGSTLNITPATLVAHAEDKSKTYDGQVYGGGYSIAVTGLVNGERYADVVSGVPSFAGNALTATVTGSYAIVPGGLAATNYHITYADGTLTINKAPLNINANAAAKTYDGIAYSGGNGVSYNGFVNGEDESVLGGTLAYSGTAQAAINVGSYAIAPGGLTAANYDITYTDGTLTINKATLNISANAATKTYDGVGYSGGNGVSYNGFVAGENESVLLGTLAYTGSSQSALNVGSYVITPHGLTTANYNINYTDGTLTISKAVLNINANAAAKIYDGVAYSGGNGVSYSGFVAGEDESVLGGTLAFSGTSQAAINAGSYAIIPSGLTSANYDINYLDGILTINKAVLNVTANGATKTYDGLAYGGGNGVSYSGFIGNEDESVLGGTLAYTGTAQSAVNVGSYTIVAGGLTAANYDINYTDGTLAINMVVLTVTANAAAKTYDGVAYSGGNGVQYTGFVAGENESVLGGTLAYSGTAQSAMQVGSYTIVPNGFTATNYNISYAGGPLTISKAPLNVAANAAAKTYDGIAYSGGNGVQYTGFVNGEDESVLGGTLAYSGTAQAAVNVGNYAIAPSGLTAANYDITYTDGTLTINKATLNITANAATKTYDGVGYSGGNGVSYNGFVAGENESVLLGTLAYTGSSQSALNVGSYVIVPGGLSATNYDINYLDGMLTIGKAMLYISANAASKIYDGMAYSGGNGVLYSGFITGEDESVLSGTLVYGGTAQSAVNVGSYAIVPGGLTATNYNITYADGNLSINKAVLHVGANTATKTYDGVAYNGGNGVSYTGFVNDEDKTVLGGTLAYSGNAQGAVNVGSYTIVPGGLTSGNYDINYTDGTLSINKTTLNITANAATKTYDGLAYSGGNGVQYIGFVAGENESVLGGTLTYAGTAQTAINVGSYTIVPRGLTAANYDITYANNTLTIGKAALNIIANAATKNYDGVGYNGGNGVRYIGFIGNENELVLGGTLAYSGTAQTAVNVGSYAITPGGLTSANYDITYTDGTLTISKAVLSITANAQTKTYDGIAYSGGNGISYSGFVHGEDESVLSGTLVFSGTAQAAVNVGNYAIAPGGLSANNYEIHYADGILSISKAQLVVSANAAAKTYDGVRYQGGNGVSYSGFAGSEGVAVLSGTITYTGTAQSATNVGSYTIVPGGLTAANYNITFTSGILTIGKAALNVTVNAATKTYDGVAYSGGNGVRYTGFVNREDESVLGGTLAYSGNSQAALNVGSYAIVAGGLSAANYEINYNDGTLTITKAILHVTANAAAKTYDGVRYQGGNGVRYTGFIGNENELVLSGTLTYSGSAQSSVNAGSYEIVPGGLAAANYNITYTGGTLTINKATLSVSADAATKTYDGVAYSGGNGVRYSGFAGNDNELVLGGTLNYSGTAQSAVNVGSYTIAAGGLTAANYNITYTNGTLTIGKAPLNVIANAATKTYDGVSYSGGNGLSYTGFVGSDGASVLSGTPVYSGTAQSAINVGNYTIRPGGLAAANYNISYIDGTLTIVPAQLRVSAVSQSKVYDGRVYAGNHSVRYTGLASGETPAVLRGTLVYEGNWKTATAAGNYTINPSGLMAANYTLVYEAGNLLIDAAPLTVVVDNKGKVYNNQPYGGGYTLSFIGLAANQTAQDAVAGTPLFTGPAISATQAGSYAIAATGLTAANYTIRYQPGTLTISKAPLQVVVAPAAKTYDGRAFQGGNGYHVAGLVAGEDASVLNGSLQYGGNAQGAVSVGSYSLNAHGLQAANYTISYTTGTLTIHPAVLTAKLNSAEKIYDGQPWQGSGAITFTGFVNGENSSVVQGSPRYGGTAQGIRNAGTYTIAVTGLQAANYTITYQPATLIIHPAPLTVRVHDIRKVYDGRPYSGTHGVSYKGFVAGESPSVLSGTLVYNGNWPNAVNAGTYRVLPAGLQAANYVIAYEEGRLEIAKAPLLVTADNKAKTYDGQPFNPAGYSVRYQGFVAGEDERQLSGRLQYGGTAAAATGAGSYAILPSGIVATNYEPVFATGTLLINKAPLVVRANAQSKTYDGQVFPVSAHTVSCTGLVAGEDQALVLRGTPRYGGSAIGAINAGTYAIRPEGIFAANYDIRYEEGLLTIRKADVMLMLPDVVKTYGDADFRVAPPASKSSGTFRFGLANDAVALLSGSTVKIMGVGTAPITVWQAEDRNYNAATASAKLVVQKAQLTVVANATFRCVNDSNPTLSYTIKGFVKNEDASVLRDQPQVSTTATFGSPAGLYPIAVSGGAATNYSFRYVEGAFRVGKPLRQPVELPLVSVVKGESAQLSARPFGTGYQWLPAVGLSAPNAANTEVRVQQDQDFTVRFTESTGCVVVDRVKVRVLEQGGLYVPNAFSPNGDGRNDQLRVIGPGLKLKFFRVFNRFGQMMFETTEAGKGWDGTFKGAPQPEDTYVWLLMAEKKDGSPLQGKGFVIITR